VNQGSAANNGSGTVSVVDTSNDTVIATIVISSPCSAAVGCPYGISVTPDSSHFYVGVDANTATPPVTHVAVTDTATRGVTTIP